MRTALADLGLTHLFVLYPGTAVYRMDERITAWPIGELTSLPAALGARRPERAVRSPKRT